MDPLFKQGKEVRGKTISDGEKKKVKSGPILEGLGSGSRLRKKKRVLSLLQAGRRKKGKDSSKKGREREVLIPSYLEGRVRLHVTEEEKGLLYSRVEKKRKKFIRREEARKEGKKTGTHHRGAPKEGR